MDEGAFCTEKEAVKEGRSAPATLTPEQERPRDSAKEVAFRGPASTAELRLTADFRWTWLLQSRS